MPQEDTSLHGATASVSPPPRTEGAAASEDSDGDKTSAGLSQLDLIATAYSPAAPMGQGAWIAGRYRLIQALGEGGMGTVWLAEQREPVRRMVALKVIKPGMDSKAVLARFEAERQALAMMDHPNIAHVLDGGTVQGEMGLASVGTPRPFFVMELVKGLPLLAWCDEKKLPIRERLKLFIQVCAAVQHAHQKGILHRDLKPSNVLVMEQDGQPVPKVIDFGLAKAVHGPQLLTDKTLQTAFGAMIGTPLYMAPEQLGGKTQDVDTRADAYSLGVILYELLTGTTPIETSRLKDLDWDQTRQLIRDEEPPLASQRLAKHADRTRLCALRATEPTALVKQLRGDLDWIAAKALDKDRDRRYETVNGLAMDVQRHLADEPVLASPPSVTYRFGKFARKNRVMLTAAATVFLALVAGVIGTALGLVEARHQRDEANLARQEEAKQRANAEANEKKARAAAEAEREAKEHADQQRAVADAVNSFLHHDLLGQAYVGNQVGGAGLAERNPNITVRELLDRAERTIEGKFGDQPKVEAAVRQSLGDTYWALGEYAIALPNMERAVQLRSEWHGPGHALTLSSKNNLALVHQALGNFMDAEALFREVIAVNTTRLGADHLETLMTVANLAGVFVAMGRYADAEPLLLRVVALRTDELGADHHRTLEAKCQLAQLYHDQGRYAKAEPLMLEVIQTSTEKQGADHPTTLSTRHDLARLYSAQRDSARAEPLYRQVIADFEAKLGPRHIATLQARNGRATLFMDVGRRAEAEKEYREVLALSTAKLGADHPETLTFKNNLGVLYHSVGDHAKAEPLLRQVLAARLSKLGKDHPNTLVSFNNLGLLEQSQGQYARAVEHFLRAYQGSLTKLGPDHPSTILYCSNLGGAYEDLREPASAEPLRRKLLETQMRREGPTSLLAASAQAALGLNLLSQRKYPEAEGPIRACLATRTVQIPDDWRTANGRSMLGEALLGQGKTDEALPLLRESQAALVAKVATIPPAYRASRLAEAAQRLAAACEKAGQGAEAVKWRGVMWAAVE